jgi:hypothetical protein
MWEQMNRGDVGADFRSWRFADMQNVLVDVRVWGRNGHATLGRISVGQSRKYPLRLNGTIGEGGTR